MANWGCGDTLHSFSLFDFPCGGHVLPWLYKQQDWYDDPDSIEKDQINPQVQEVTCLQIFASSQPFWTECHPS